MPVVMCMTHVVYADACGNECMCCHMLQWIVVNELNQAAQHLNLLRSFTVLDLCTYISEMPVLVSFIVQLMLLLSAVSLENLR